MGIPCVRTDLSLRHLVQYFLKGERERDRERGELGMEERKRTREVVGERERLERERERKGGEVRGGGEEENERGW